MKPEKCKCCDQIIVEPLTIDKYPFYCKNSCHYYKLYSPQKELHICDLSENESISVLSFYDYDGLGYKGYTIGEHKKITKSEFDKKLKETIKIMVGK